MAIAFAHHGILYLVLDEENIDRVQQYDPFDFNTKNAPFPLALKIPLEVVVAYAKKDEQDAVAKMGPEAAVKHLRRGYKVTDTDFARVIPYRTLQ